MQLPTEIEQQEFQEMLHHLQSLSLLLEWILFDVHMVEARIS